MRNHSANLTMALFVIGCLLTVWGATGTALVSGAVTASVEGDSVFQVWCIDPDEEACREQGGTLILNFLGSSGNHGFQPGSTYTYEDLVGIENLWLEPLDMTVRVDGDLAGDDLGLVVTASSNGETVQVFPRDAADGDAVLTMTTGQVASLSFAFTIPVGAEVGSQHTGSLVVTTLVPTDEDQEDNDDNVTRIVTTDEEPGAGPATLSVAKRVRNLDMVGVGDLIEFDVVVSNGSDEELDSVLVTDLYPVGLLEFVAVFEADGTPVTAMEATGSVSWQAGPLAAGEQRSYVVGFRALAPRDDAQNEVVARSGDGSARATAAFSVATQQAIEIQEEAPVAGPLPVTGGTHQALLIVGVSLMLVGGGLFLWRLRYGGASRS